MSKYKDFDAYWAEQEREPIELRAMGIDLKMPPAMPATILLKVMRAMKEHGSEAAIPVAQQMELLEAAIGKEKLELLCQKGIDIEQLGDLVIWIMEQYTGKNVAPPTKGQQSTSLRTGRKSKRTSSANTK